MASHRSAQTIRFQRELHQSNAASRAYQRVSLGVFVACHLAPLGALWSGVTWESVALCVGLYLVRMFAITAGYHRYFSHRTFKTSRAMQLLFAFLAETSSQRGVLWWVAHHRHHHKHSDEPDDVHSALQRGFWHSHFGWIWNPNTPDRQASVRDLQRFPELVWLDANWLVPSVAAAVFCLVVAGWPGLFIGFFLSTVLLWHGTFTINSLTHVWGSRRYRTADNSRNNLWLALITLGEGWHNNHHFDMLSCRQGFFWWEIDVTYLVLRAMAAVGLVWDLRPPKPEAYAHLDKEAPDRSALVPKRELPLAALHSEIGID